MSAITVRDVWVEYGDQIVLERINLEIASGAFVSIVGPSRLRQDHLPAPAARPGAADPRHDPARRRAAAGRAGARPRRRVPALFGVSASDGAAATCCSASNSPASPLLGAAVRRGAPRGASRRARRCSTRVGLGAASRQISGALSGGMQQRLAIAQALARRAAGAAARRAVRRARPRHAREMHELITPLWRERGMTMFMVTHDIKEAFELGTRVLAFDQSAHDPQAPGRYRRDDHLRSRPRTATAPCPCSASRKPLDDRPTRAKPKEPHA